MFWQNPSAKWQIRCQNFWGRDMLFDRFENGFKKRFDRHLADMKNMEIPKAAKSYEKSSFSYEKLLFSVAAEEGFEPSQTESESVVLPLHNSAIHNAALPCDLYSIHREWLCVKLFFQENKKCFMQKAEYRIGRNSGI